MASPQNYPRIHEQENRYEGFLDDTKLIQHNIKISKEKFRNIISSAINTANKKSSRAILDISYDVPENEMDAILLKAGNELFKYFVKYFF